MTTFKQTCTLPNHFFFTSILYIYSEPQLKWHVQYDNLEILLLLLLSYPCSNNWKKVCRISPISQPHSRSSDFDLFKRSKSNTWHFQPSGKNFDLLKRSKSTSGTLCIIQGAVLVLTDRPTTQIYCLEACLTCSKVWDWHRLRRRRCSWPKLATIGGAMAKKG